MVTVTDNAVAYTCGGLHIYEDIKNIVLSFAAAVLCDSQIIVKTIGG